MGSALARGETCPKYGSAHPLAWEGTYPPLPEHCSRPLDSHRAPDFRKLESFHLLPPTLGAGRGQPARGRKVHFTWSLPCHWGPGEFGGLEAEPGQPHCHQHWGFHRGQRTGWTSGRFLPNLSESLWFSSVGSGSADQGGGLTRFMDFPEERPLFPRKRK